MEPQAEGGIISAINAIIPGGIANIFNFGLGIGAVLALATIIYAGILYSVSGDNASKQKEAREWIIAAAKGLAVIAFGFIILSIANPRATQIREIFIDETPFIEVSTQPVKGYTYSPDYNIGEHFVGSLQIPLLKQGDSRWGGEEFGPNCRRIVNGRIVGTYATAGCGPAVIAMALLYHNVPNINVGNAILNAGQTLINQGHRVCGSGTSHRAMVSVPEKFGLNSDVIGDSKQRIIDCLNNNGVVISHMEEATEGAYDPNDKYRRPIFTKFGHFIVVKGIDTEENRVYINDPGGRNVQASEINHFIAYNSNNWCVTR